MVPGSMPLTGGWSHYPPQDRMMHTCENITFPQLGLLAVNIWNGQKIRSHNEQFYRNPQTLVPTYNEHENLFHYEKSIELMFMPRCKLLYCIEAKFDSTQHQYAALSHISRPMLWGTIHLKFKKKQKLQRSVFLLFFSTLQAPKHYQTTFTL